MGRRGDGSFLPFDRLLLPRVEQYAHNNSISSLEATADYLRTCYPEYQRKQLGPFRKMVAAAIKTVRQKVREEESTVVADEDNAHDESRRRRVDSAEARLECREKQHVSRRKEFSSDVVSSDSDGESDVKVSSARKSSQFDESSDDSAEPPKPAFNLLNSSLMATYSARPALVIQSPTFNGTSVFGNVQVDPQNPASSENAEQEQNNKPAFAAPEVIAAASRGKKSPKTPKNSGVTADNSTRKREREKSDPRSRSQAVKKIRPVGEKDVSEFQSYTGTVSFKDFGGLGSTIDELAEFFYPVRHPAVYEAIGLQPSRGLLLHGPPGCGKTTLAEAIANEAKVPFLKISAPEIVSGTSGESEAKLRTLFSEAASIAPSLIFIDEIDCISSKRESAHKDMERRIVTQLMTCMDELGHRVQMTTVDDADEKRPSHVLVIGATNRPDALDQALRRRFEREISLGIPDENARAQILKVLTKNLRLEGNFDFKVLARRTPGYVGADLKTLTKEAGAVAIRRIIRSRSKATEDDGSSWWETSWTPEELQGLSITMEDFEDGIKRVQPSTKREGFTEIPKVTFDDVGSLESVREELELFICRRVKHPEIYEVLGFTDSGFLLYGPPGCGKTLLAKAVANSAGVNFIYVKAGELLNKYVGESERAVRQLFTRARACSPCIIFFDEVDALAPNRGNEANGATDRVVNQLLVEMDGLEQRKSIFLLAATNRPNMIDPALLRPGRLGKRIYVPMPDAQGRASILTALVRRIPLAADVDIQQITADERCKDFSGADLYGLVQEACAAAIRERFALSKDNGEPTEAVALTQKHFLEALSKQNPSVSVKDYDKDFTCSTQGERKRASRVVASCSKV